MLTSRMHNAVNRVLHAADILLILQWSIEAVCVDEHLSIYSKRRYLIVHHVNMQHMHGLSVFLVYNLK